MTSRRDGRQAAASAGADVPHLASSRQAALASLPAPPFPPGAGRVLANRAMVYLRPGQVDAVLPHVSSSGSGMILAGNEAREARQTVQDLRDRGVEFPVLVDPAAYRKVAATREAPFILPGVGGLASATLEDVLDAQIRDGAPAALSPTGFMCAAGGSDALKAAARQFRGLTRTDSVFVAPLDAALLSGTRFAQTAAILADVGHPVALILGGQGDPLDHRSDLIPNLRVLAASVPLIAMRTDFNGLDLIAHGAISAAIGTGGSIRHAVDPADPVRAFNTGPAPSVLVPELASWFKGSKIAKLFGARPSLAPRCSCAVCGGQRLTRFLRREHQDEAIAHAVAVWSTWAGDIFGLATMRDRAHYWKNLCTGAVTHHSVFLQQLQLLDGLKPQAALRRWAALPAWSTDVSAPVS